MAERSLTTLLEQRANRRPGGTAYTFIDYEVDPAGVAESLTWAQLQSRAHVVAEQLLRDCGSSGGRAAILAPQGLDYIVAFFGAVQAGFVAVPLPVPQFGVHDARISSALRDCRPSAVLTTSSVAGRVAPYTEGGVGKPAPAVIEVDLLEDGSAAHLDPIRPVLSETAYLQYSSGSTREPTGVVITNKNVIANVEQCASDYIGSEVPPETVFVSWLPFYHDMGWVVGVCAPLVLDRTAVLMSPSSFLRRPARWMQLLATNYRSFTGAPTVAFELAARRTSDNDLAGLHLGDVLGIACGAERVHAATIGRFTERFARFGLKESVIRPSYGLAEATVYVATSDYGRPPKVVRFDYEKLSSGYAKRCGSEAVGATDLIGHGTTRSNTLRIVDPETRRENPAERVGEIWVHGENVAEGYWQKPEETERTFGACLANPSPGTPAEPWLRTGDLGVISDDELFIIGRIKDLIIVNGSNHYPDDIEATIQEITGGRVAAISIPNGRREQLVAIVEVTMRGQSDEEQNQKLRSIKHRVTSAIADIHRLRVADLVCVAPGSIPITTSGKVRRSACSERYRQNEFERLDAQI
jgi:long chain fatty acid CoA FadD26